MNINMNTSVAMAQQSSNDTVGMSVLKKAMDIEAQSAQVLINTMPTPSQSASNLPPHLGQNINITA